MKQIRPTHRIAAATIRNQAELHLGMQEMHRHNGVLELAGQMAKAFFPGDLTLQTRWLALCGIDGTGWFVSQYAN